MYGLGRIAPKRGGADHAAALRQRRWPGVRATHAPTAELYVSLTVARLNVFDCRGRFASCPSAPDGDVLHQGAGKTRPGVNGSA